jgi:hypothetical protein
LDLNENDVLCGRGRLYVGNVLLRRKAEERLQEYQASPPFEKGALAWEIMKEIQEAGGRFLKETKNGGWLPIPDSEVSTGNIGSF